ncbi:MAG: sugar ABC transporter ATP-binding protein [Planctomycetes bacterium]|nr:sugar ABC transporter ATP-binding protein [Planctomycetota bacterium]
MRLSMQGIDLAYGEAQVLHQASLQVAAGEVHALLGENGAGKSSLMKVLAGAVMPHAGTIELDGRPLAVATPMAAQAAGVAMIWQELTLLPHLTIAENLALGRTGRALALPRQDLHTAAAAALAAVQRQDLDPDTRVSALAPADRQMVEIARAVARQARVLVMDEPTSSLGREDVQRLFLVISRLRAQGLAILYISHFLEEVRVIADRFTVLRDGCTVASGRLADTTDAALVAHMAGRSISELYPAGGRTPGASALVVTDLVGVPLPVRASFELRRGEILGIGGLCGAGRTELLETIFGLRPTRAGRIEFAVAPGVARRPASLWRHGIGFLAEDRKTIGLSLQRPIGENIVLPSAGRDGPWLPPARVAGTVRAWLSELRIKARGPGQRAGTLSGGNQQKVAFARLLAAEANVLLLDEPTRGIDVGARQEIYALLDRLARQGAAILLVSSQLPELLGLCDRIAVLCRGVLSAARPVAQWTQESLLQAALAQEVA